MPLATLYLEFNWLIVLLACVNWFIKSCTLASELSKLVFIFSDNSTNVLFKLASIFFSAKVFIILVLPLLNVSLISIHLLVTSSVVEPAGRGAIPLLILTTFSAVALALSVTTILSACSALSSTV